MEITKESWEALVQGQLRDARKIRNLVKQVEKLSFQLELEITETNEFLDEEYGPVTPDRFEGRMDYLDNAWYVEKEARYERLTPYV